MPLSRRGFLRQVLQATAGSALLPLLPAAPVSTSPAILPGPIEIPFAALPASMYIRGPRYRVMFDRIVTPQFVVVGEAA